jgi:hypothetical protein
MPSYRKRRTTNLSRTERRRAVARVLCDNESTCAVAKEVGLPPGKLLRWVRSSDHISIRLSWTPSLVAAAILTIVKDNGVLVPFTRTHATGQNQVSTSYTAPRDNGIHAIAWLLTFGGTISNARAEIEVNGQQRTPAPAPKPGPHSEKWSEAVNV